MGLDKPKFVFMDESGRKESDRFFVCGFLEIENNQAFSFSLRRVADQIKNLSIRNRLARVQELKKKKDIGQLYNLAKNFSEFELKYYHVTAENLVLYCDLVKAVFRKTKPRFTAIVVDRLDPLYEKDPDGQLPLYLKVFKLYSKFCAKTSNYIFVPDNFDSGFKWNVKTGNLPKEILPLDSKACLQLQVADVLSGIVGQSLKLAKGERFNNKDNVRMPMIKTLEKELGKKIESNLTVSKDKWYFSLWIVDWSKKKRSGHGQETQPRP